MTTKTTRLRGISLMLIGMLAGAAMVSPAWAGGKLATKKFVKKRIAKAVAPLTGGIEANAAGIEANAAGIDARLHDDPTIHQDTSETNSQTFRQASVMCPAGKVAISGGGRLIEGMEPATTVSVQAFPTGPEGGAPTGWFAGGRETSATSESWAVRAYVVCVTA